MFFTVFLLFASAFTLNQIPDAEAIKAKGTPASQINSNKVCGDRLCSETGEQAKEESLDKYFETEDSSNPNTIPDDAEFLFVQAGESATFIKKNDGYLLTIFEVSPQTIYFSDRPYRLSGHMTTLDWADGLWTDPEVDFKGDPPNAVIAFSINESNVEMIPVELLAIKYNAEENTLQYEVKVLNNYFESLEGPPEKNSGNIQHSVGNVSLFIDGVGKWIEKTAKKIVEPEIEEAEFVKKLGVNLADFAAEVWKGKGQYDGVGGAVGYCKDGVTVWALLNHPALLKVAWVILASGGKDILKSTYGSVKDSFTNSLETSAEEGAEEGAEAGGDTPVGALVEAYLLANYIAMIDIDENNHHKGAYIVFGVTQGAPHADTQACRIGHPETAWRVNQDKIE